MASHASFRNEAGKDGFIEIAHRRVTFGSLNESLHTLRDAMTGELLDCDDAFFQLKKCDYQACRGKLGAPYGELTRRLK